MLMTVSTETSLCVSFGKKFKNLRTRHARACNGKYGIAHARTNRTEHGITWSANAITIRTVLACNQQSSYASVCDGLDQYNRHQEARHRERPELSTDELANLTHRKDLTASGDRVRDIS